MKGLARLAKLYAQVERARLVEVRAAATLCDEVKLLRERVVSDLDRHKDGTRQAFAEGDAAGRRVGEAVRAATLVHASRLAELNSERDLTRELAEELHRESRLRAEQMQRMFAGAREKEALEESRKAQAVADDRFGSRMRWTQSQVGMKGR